MIIVPTEKQFDWKHAPLVLIGIVLLNIFVFFFYQSGDDAKGLRAYEMYGANNLNKIEWPLYKDYIKKTEGEEAWKELTFEGDEEYNGEDYISDMVFDREFSQYLHANARQLIADKDYHDWQFARNDVDREVNSISSFRFGLTPNDITVTTTLTSQFLHGDTMHLLGNMFFLVICGFAVEAALGHLRFLLFYLISGIVAGLTHALIDKEGSIPLIGASGAISGVMAMYLGVFRLKKIEFFYWIFVFVGYFRAPALLLLPFYIGKEVMDYYGNEDSNVAFLAHAGGFAAGALLTLGTFLIKRDLINEDYIEADQTIDPYQEKLSNIYKAIEHFQFTAASRNLQQTIDEYGPRFELQVLRYNLLKLDKSEGFQPAAYELLTHKADSDQQRAQQEKLWNDNPELHDALDDESKMLLAMNLAVPGQFATAEQLFKQLNDSNGKNPQLTNLARRLVVAAEKLKDIPKKKMYQQFAGDIV